MVTLLDLKKEKMQALKARDKDREGILGIVITNYQLAEVEKKAKNETMSDADMVSCLNKTLKGLEDEVAMYQSAGREEDAKKALDQVKTVKEFLPQMMSEEEVKAVIEKLPDHSIKTIMSSFKKDYAGKADMGMVSRIAKSYQGK